MPRPFAEHAIDYNDYSLSIIPCGKNKGKISLVKWQQYQEEAADLSVFDSWIDKFPTANIGLITGRINNLLIVDCDDPKLTIEALQEKYGETPLIVQTPRGGKHLYYKYNGEPCYTGFSNKIDIRGDGGYVIAPPSINLESGKPYTFIKGSLENIKKLPTSIYSSLLKNHLEVNSNKALLRSKGGKVLEGQRNKYLFKETKNYAVTVNTYDEILNYAERHNIENLRPQLPNSEVLQIVRSVWKYKKENRIWLAGEKHISIPDDKFIRLCKNPRALVLYMFLVKYHDDNRDNFLIIHEKIAERLGCERKTVPKNISYLIDQKIIERVHISKGKNDGHKYKFC